MNIINLLELIRNQVDYTTAHKIIDDFMTGYGENHINARYTKGTAKKAIDNYIKAAAYKDGENIGIYTNGRTVLMTTETAETAAKVSPHLEKRIVEMIKDRQPEDCYLIDSILLYKALKKQENQDYFLQIGGRFYNPDLVNEVLNCVCTNKEKYIRCDICTNGALFIQQDTTAALILPIVRDKCHISENVNFRDFLKYIKELENNLLNEAIRKTA